MAWAVSADPDRFEEAIDWFSRRFPVTEELLASLREFAGPRAWTIANVAHLDVVLFVFERLQSAIAKGTTLDEFRAEVSESLTEAWGKPNAPRVNTIFRNAVQTSYNRGRWQQITDPDVVGVRPFLMFDAILDARRSPICKSLSEPKPVIRPVNDPYWLDHQPPLHHQCRSSLRSLTKRQAEQRGITTDPPDAAPADGWGGVDPEWQPNSDKYPSELWAVYQAKVAAR